MPEAGGGRVVIWVLVIVICYLVYRVVDLDERVEDLENQNDKELK